MKLPCSQGQLKTPYFRISIFPPLPENAFMHIQSQAPLLPFQHLLYIPYPNAERKLRECKGKGLTTKNKKGGGSMEGRTQVL